MNYEEFTRKYKIHLTDEQTAAVQAIDGPTLVLAVPGSGKTTVLITRLGWMIFGPGIQPERILTVTYTTAAAGDMRERFAEKFGEDLASRLQFRTINSFSLQILRYYRQTIGAPAGKPAFRTAGEKEARALVRRAWQEVSQTRYTENDIADVMTAINYIKNLNLPRERWKEADCSADRFEEIFDRYQQLLIENRLIDFDDQMIYALRILKRYPAVLAHFRNLFSHISVDEAQDTSRIQHQIIGMIARPAGNLFMVGDEDQSIYGFRGAWPEALTRFEQDWPGARVLIMSKNFRSVRSVVRGASLLIAHNQERHEKKMTAARKEEGRSAELPLKSWNAQYKWLLRVAEDIQKQDTSAPETTAVLYRNNESALPLIDLLDRAGLPCRLRGSDAGFFSSRQIWDIRDFLRLAEDGSDAEAFLRIYYKTNCRLTREAASRAVSRAGTLKGRKNLFDLAAALPTAGRYVRSRCAACARILREAPKKKAGDVIRDLIWSTGYMEYLREKKQDTHRLEILQALAWQEEDATRFTDRLDQLRDLLQSGSESPSAGGPRLILSTVHSAKGLEFDRVYLLDMKDGISPAPCRDESPESQARAMEEERRLYYVAATRARDQLYVFTNENRPDEVSPFTLEFFGRPPASPRRKQAAARAGAGARPSPSRRARTAIQAAKTRSGAGAGKFLAGIPEGSRVSHRKFGPGTVTAKDSRSLTIRFDADGETRRLDAEVLARNRLLKKL